MRDSEIKKEVQEVLRLDAVVDHALIDVDVQDDAVEISCIVGSGAEKSGAISDARVTGAESVDAAALKVERWARDPDLRKDKYVVKDDDSGGRAVRDAFLRDPRLEESDVSVDVDANIAIRRGKVDSLRAKRAAARDARNTDGFPSSMQAKSSSE